MTSLVTRLAGSSTPISERIVLNAKTQLETQEAKRLDCISAFAPDNADVFSRADINKKVGELDLGVMGARKQKQQLPAVVVKKETSLSTVAKDTVKKGFSTKQKVGIGVVAAVVAAVGGFFINKFVNAKKEQANVQ